MVGYDDYKRDLSSFDYATAGAVSGFVTRAVCQPLDVLKIRFQLQVEPISKSSTSKYRSISQATCVIVREEGIKALWKGHVPAQLLSIVYGTTQFWCYEVLTRKIATSNLTIPVSNKPFVNFTCGAISGCTATLASFPFDVVRTRLVFQSKDSKLYTGVGNAFKQMVQHEGGLVLFRGLLPTFLQIAPYSGVLFMAYTIFDNAYRNIFKFENATFSFMGSLASGGIAGVCAKTAIYPFDLAKKRMQIQGIEESRKSFGKVFVCKGMIDCFRNTYRYEGFSGLFKGLSPSLLKAVFTSALYFASYEQALSILYSLHS